MFFRQKKITTNTHTWLSWVHELVRDRELAKVVARHLRLDLDSVENLAVVDTDDGTDHLRHDDHITQMRLHGGGLLVRGRSGLGFAQFFDETHRALLETTLEPTSSASVYELFEVIEIFE